GAASGITDAVGNAMTATATEQFTVDLEGPTATVTAVTPDPRNTAVNTVTIVFSEPVSGFDLADLRLTRNGGANLLTGSQTLATTDNVTWTLGNLEGLTFTGGSYALAVVASGSGVKDRAGNAMAANATETWVLDP